MGGRQGSVSSRALPPVPSESGSPAAYSQSGEKPEAGPVFGGKQVVNLVVDGAPNNGDALAAERERLRCSRVLYVGDDENDEDAFAWHGNTILSESGRQRQSHARYYIRAQDEIDKLLGLLVLLRAPLRRSSATLSPGPHR